MISIDRKQARRPLLFFVAAQVHACHARRDPTCDKPTVWLLDALGHHNKRFERSLWTCYLK
jgi:hypothetical protein